ncbi:hypothetical protein KIPB_005986 [Kipferlia bialata]|uniref:Basic immunoglobulin-like variable motif-containing protein n=1 Tax=Kipferlia bialata TaxID=797122 RepID=A0A9K3CWA9_9EUKA|nr:hypothetical protein KIPB_005986 [Kipferlia bialata]|eukprot:g5986.t1
MHHNPTSFFCSASCTKAVRAAGSVIVCLWPVLQTGGRARRGWGQRAWQVKAPSAPYYTHTHPDRTMSAPTTPVTQGAGTPNSSSHLWEHKNPSGTHVSPHPAPQPLRDMRPGVAFEVSWSKPSGTKRRAKARKAKMPSLFADDDPTDPASAPLDTDMGDVQQIQTVEREREGEGAVSESAPVVDTPSPVLCTPDQMANRKVLDVRRWFCMSRPQYKASCGISSLVSVWNYLFSTLGQGTLPVLSQERALTILGFKAPFNAIRFGPFTGNATLQRWFKLLNQAHGVKGSCGYLYKVHGKNRTRVSPSCGMHRTCSALRRQDMGLIYHCYNHYNVPVGYEATPKPCTDAYSVNGLCADPTLTPDDQHNTWVLISDPSRTSKPLTSLRWDFIHKDIGSVWPEIYNARHPERGPVKPKTKKRPSCETEGDAGGDVEAGGLMPEGEGEREREASECGIETEVDVRVEEEEEGGEGESESEGTESDTEAETEVAPVPPTPTPVDTPAVSPVPTPETSQGEREREREVETETAIHTPPLVASEAEAEGADVVVGETATASEGDADPDTPASTPSDTDTDDDGAETDSPGRVLMIDTPMRKRRRDTDTEAFPDSEGEGDASVRFAPHPSLHVYLSPGHDHLSPSQGGREGEAVGAMEELPSFEITACDSSPVRQVGTEGTDGVVAEAEAETAPVKPWAKSKPKAKGKKKKNTIHCLLYFSSTPNLDISTL